MEEVPESGTTENMNFQSGGWNSSHMANTATGNPRPAHGFWPSTHAWTIFLIVVLAMLLDSCRQPAREPVTLTYPHGWWSEPDELAKGAALSHQFTQETGIHIRNILTPENTLDGLDLLLKLLRRGSSGADVLDVDLIYSAVLEPDLIDLQPYSTAEISSIEPQLLPSYTVNGKVVALPYQVNVGALEYRTDLLREYGYDYPPKTWDELEVMAARIQAGERAKGRKDFWGYVWQGATSEALTCDALEWQASEGGGRIIESDRIISVNNPAAIRTWQRVKQWIGRISTPSVVAYQERDSMNIFDSGGAAFNRVWLGTTILPSEQTHQVYWRSSPPLMKTGFTGMPGASRGSAATLGGYGLAVSRHSIHRQEAIQFVRFLVHEQIQSSKKSTASDGRAEVYNVPSVSDQYHHFQQSMQHGSALVNRPSNETGHRYRQVSAAYAGAVHAVLTGQKRAPEAAAELEKQLIQMTGFRTGPPKT